MFPRATAVAPWTVPSHATIFTGLYPWEHRAHAKGNLPLGAGFPRLPAMLREAGYATLSLSANPLVNSELGLADGFESAAWSEWWEPYIRNTRRGAVARPLVGGTESAGDRSSRLQQIHDSPFVSVLHKLAGLVYRFPFALDAVNQLTRRVYHPARREHAEVARWIDPTFEKWLATTPADRPVFAFVNLLEAHEPYYVDRSVIRGPGDYWRYLRTWQDRPSVLNGVWSPSPEERDLLRRLYVSTFRLLDDRVGGLVRALQASGRWENTVFIVTSDHGQAFFEKGTLFHMHRPDEELLRIPLWIRYPGNARGGTNGQGWTSLVDVAPTVLDAAGLPLPASFSGVPLSKLETAERLGPALAMADGLALPQERSKIPPDRLAWIDRLWSVAYENEGKVTLDVKAGVLQAYDLGKDPGELQDVWPIDSTRFEALAAAAERVGTALTGQPAARFSSGVEERLRSWGYL